MGLGEFLAQESNHFARYAACFYPLGSRLGPIPANLDAAEGSRDLLT
jgi:hypothetical protein